MSFCNFNADKSDDDDDFIIEDSFSSDYNEEFRTNSSSSSLKWSVDARKQNEEDWLSIERILYSEESLPEDDKTREEFQSWMRAFPHLRIVGVKINLPPKSQQRVAFEQVDEVFAIDPPMQHFYSEPFRLLDHELNEKLSIRKQARQASGTNQSRAEDLEKLLRITSSGLTRNQQQPRPPSSKKVIDRTSTFIIKQNSVKKLSKIQEHKKFEVSPATMRLQQRELDNKLSYSATSSSRLNPILSNKFIGKKPLDILDDVKSVKSASKLPLYADISTYDGRQKLPKQELSSKSASIHHHHKLNQNNIQLPPFNYDLDFPIIQGRGYHNQKSAKFLQH